MAEEAARCVRPKWSRAKRGKVGLLYKAARVCPDGVTHGVVGEGGRNGYHARPSGLAKEGVCERVSLPLAQKAAFEAVAAMIFQIAGKMSGDEVGVERGLELLELQSWKRELEGLS